MSHISLEIFEIRVSINMKSLTKTTPSSPDERTSEPNHWPVLLSYCWPVGANVLPKYKSDGKSLTIYYETCK